MRRLLPVLFLLFWARMVGAQVVTWTPSHPTIDDSIVIEFDAALGNGALIGVTPVFAHSGVLTKFSTDVGDWQHQKSSWDSGYDSAIVMLSLGGTRHRISFKPRTYYGCNSSEEVRALAFVFRNTDGSLAGKNSDGSDILIPIYPNTGFSAVFASPMERPELQPISGSFVAEVRSTQPSLITLYQEGLPFAQSSGLVSQFSVPITCSTMGRYQLSFSADNGSTILRDTIAYVVQPSITVSAQPIGTRDGINYINDSTVTLVLLAPQKSYAYVIGDFNDWQMDPQYLMQRTPDGQRYWLEIRGLTAGQEYRFQYFVDHKVKVGDPYAEKVLDQFNDNGVNNFIYPNLIDYPIGKTTELVTVLQTAKPEYSWEVANFQRQDNRDLVIYELLVRDFVQRHDYGTLIDTLDYLERLGINCIELMPVNEFDGNQSWGYGPAYYFAPDKYYGTELKLKEFIDSCHSRGISVVLDVVFNHAFGQCPLVRLYQDRGTGVVAGNNPWLNVETPHPLSPGFDFNHESGYTQAFFDSVLSYWAREYHVDGFRFDLSKGFTNTYSGTDIGLWSQYDQSRVDLLKRMSTRLWTYNGGLYFILEHLGNNDEETELANHGMMLWGKASEPYYQAGMGYEASSDFSWYISHQHRGWGLHNLVGFIESHDEERAMFKNYEYGNGTNPAHDCRDTTVALKRMAALAAFWATVPGPKMMWQFAELGYDVSINVPCRTCPKPIRWNYFQEYHRQLLFKRYSAIIRLKTRYPDAFRSSSYDISAWGKQKQIHVNSTAMNVTVIGNFDVFNQDTWTGFQHTGRWYDYMAGDSLQVTDVNMVVPLVPGDFKIYTDLRIPKPDLTVSITNPNGFGEEAEAKPLVAFANPNPFQDRTTFHCLLSKPGSIELSILDLNGRQVHAESIAHMPAGLVELPWNGRDDYGNPVASGMYIFQIESSGKTTQGRIAIQH